MLKRILILVTVLVLALTASAAAFADTMWIKTGNGKPANARSAPSKDSDWVGEFPYGSMVYTMGTAPINGYTELSLDGKGVRDENVAAFRYALVESDEMEPAEQIRLYRKLELPVAALVFSGGRSVIPSSSDGNGSLSAIYNEFKAARWVTPYDVVTWHNRSSGIINMRYAPSKNAPLVNTYKPGETLQVLCEMKDWYEVQDPDTGRIGFIRYDFLRR